MCGGQAISLRDPYRKLGKMEGGARLCGTGSPASLFAAVRSSAIVNLAWFRGGARPDVGALPIA